MLSNFTVRMDNETKEDLAKLSKNENLTQGEFIKKLLEIYKNLNPTNLFVPLEYKVFNTHKASNKYNFSGRLMYRTNLTEALPDSISHLKISLKIDNAYLPSICLYAYSIFILADKRFLLHEMITMSSTNDTISYLSQDIYVQRAVIKNSIEDLIEIIKYHATAQDISNIKLSNVQGTSDESILDEYFN